MNVNCFYPVTRGAMAAVAMSIFAPWSQGQTVGDVFVIALENHNFTQPASVTSPQQLYGNPAAPYLNSLVTPGNANAVQSSYATNYTNAGNGVHPSEPNYIWQEAGTNYNKDTGTTVLGDGDPTPANGNIFTNTPHLTGQLNSVGVSWHNYEEDVQVSGNGPTVSSSGTLPGGATNPYNGRTQYNYAVKHNPMAFFNDTATQHVSPISQLNTDLSNNTVARYNWITPNQYNDMHSALTGGFTYKGVNYTGDQAAIAQGDNFLSTVVPVIEASQAYQNNGAIVIWGDETEGGDQSLETIPEIVISPLAKGNAFASSVAMSHSSDIKTYDELFQTGSFLNNTIPATETAAGGVGYNNVSTVNDLSSLFASGAIPSSVPEPASIGLVTAGMLACRRRRMR